MGYKSDSGLQVRTTLEPPDDGEMYTELTMLPSPSLSPGLSSSGIFKQFNGQSPPMGGVSRAPSIRQGSNGSVKSVDDVTSNRNSSSALSAERSTHLRQLDVNNVRPSAITRRSSERISVVKTRNRDSSKPDEPRVYEAFDRSMRKSTWDFVRPLGRGAFSMVVLATPTVRYVKPQFRDEALSRLVAIKLVDMNAGGEPQERLEGRLKREMDILESVAHPSLMKLYAFNVDSSRALLVLPYCEGGDLFDAASTHRLILTPHMVRRIFSELAKAVAFLHARNVVHRDLKLENVLLNKNVVELARMASPEEFPGALVRVTDFGLSKQIDPENPMLTTRCGSEDYVSPELLMGQPYDGREADAWALGVILYAIIEGRLPFDPPQVRGGGGRARGRTAHRIARVEWDWTEHGFAGPEWAAPKEIVDRCLQRRNKRWTTQQIAEHDWVRHGVVDDLQALDDQWIYEYF
ncbi:serine/threonine-protein kinase Prr1p [Trichomonascus vanleenenianus]|uniref:serine/threonine protein kinase PRR1 n=1 Tax=Trichomonascus vanleenenianus TaxID=2268995 RepID=UPI003EC9C85A